jgi:hypothetical protein
VIWDSPARDLTAEQGGLIGTATLLGLFLDAVAAPTG